jgi:hypothetical protein
VREPTCVWRLASRVCCQPPRFARVLVAAGCVAAAISASPAEGRAQAPAAEVEGTGKKTKGEKRKGEPGVRAKLFESTAPLTLTLRADFKAVLRDRDTATAQWRPARLSYTDSVGQPVEVDASVRTRGIFRLRPATCAFPPLRLNIARKTAKGTVLEGIDRPKLVTHCQKDRPDYEQIILQEYLLYKMYNLLTPLSFDVRLARIRYEDTQGKMEPVTAWAFLIEEDDAMAARNGGRILKQKGARPGDLDDQVMTLVSVFQYMIGNTDWSVAGLHNATLVQLDSGSIVPVPYDFDFAGIIAARYAGVDPRLRIKSVKQRLYRGMCIPESSLAPVLDLFRAKRDAIYAVYDGFDAVTPDNAKRGRAYLDAFFEIINNERGPKYEMLGDCLQDRYP